VRTTTYLGLVLGIAVVAFAVLAKGGEGRLFVDHPALLVVLGGTFAATTLAASRRAVGHALSAVQRLFVAGPPGTRRVAEELVALSRQAKARGLESIDPGQVALRDPFLLKGLQLVADSIEPARIEELMRLESEILSERRVAARRLFRFMGSTAPLFGLVGTLIGLIQLLQGSLEARVFGQGLSVALVDSLYGVLLSALVFLPLAAKVRTLDLDERLLRDQMLAGLVAIRLGQNPEYVRETLEVFAQEKG
jgi:chemotaxis protein MotA